ncbi:MAG: hypothetical protein MUO80_00385 [Dehalococcoidia bacterium]|nr:hypothetical protein [Dehalococcoidia bacterium]
MATSLNNCILCIFIHTHDTKIDQMVYELYGLTPEEIAVVEGKGSE